MVGCVWFIDLVDCWSVQLAACWCGDESSFSLSTVHWCCRVLLDGITDASCTSSGLLSFSAVLMSSLSS